MAVTAKIIYMRFVGATIEKDKSHPFQTDGYTADGFHRSCVTSFLQNFVSSAKKRIASK